MVDTKQLAGRIRKHAVKMTHSAKSSHVGSVLSIADILAVLYGQVLVYKADEPGWNGRDRFILSKGHAGAGVYAALAESGFFDKSILDTYCQNGSILSGHVSHKDVPGVELSTGALGHGLSVASGMAYAAKLSRQSHQVVTLLSDGECDEGSVWEAALFASHHRLSNLVVVIDYNGLQSIGTTEDTLALEPFPDKWKAFGWKVMEVDGHNHGQLANTLGDAKQWKEGPVCVIANTTKGKGVSFMENSVLWHYRSPQGEEYREALRLLGEE
jgi:transketolase